MKQLSFGFAKYFSDEVYQEEQKARKNFADKYVQKSCGWLHLGWDIDAYWTKVTKHFLIPASELIYQELVKKNHTEENKLYSCTGSYQFWYIPTQSETRKVFIQDSYDRTYLFVYDESKYGQTFHIRRVWKVWSPDKSDWRTEKILDLIESKNVSGILSHLDLLENFADDHYEFSRRHSLDFYKLLDFNFDEYDDEHRIYGDARDLGYVISYEASGRHSYRIKDTIHSFGTLEYISTCALSIMAQELNINIPRINGSD